MGSEQILGGTFELEEKRIDMRIENEENRRLMEEVRNCRKIIA